MRQHVRRWASAPRVGAVGAAMVFGGAMGLRAAPPDYDFDWVTVGAPGNRSANEQEAPLLYPPYEQQPILVGAVPYTYRISKTELTVKQWYEFVQAYAPYYTGSRNSSAFTSLWIYANDQNPDHPPDFRIVSGAENHPADMSWRFAARYCNWLEN
ncbi:MAG: SUMF1/EgtB/PvdO family nonheme iron enzyme, partial [Phycisphaerae bacterium]|nr:SUMF1/EgtB/PvdO family nonheme iron enzyme [Phycisphaerae bacterium]